MKLCNRWLNFGACAAALLPGIASAVPVLPQAFYLAALQTSQHAQQEFGVPGTYTLDGASTTVDGSPFLAGHVSTAATDEQASVQSTIHYAFVVDGPVPNITVPMFVTLSVDASRGGADSGAFSYINVEHQFGSVAILHVSVQAFASNPQPGRVSATRSTGWRMMPSAEIAAHTSDPRERAVPAAASRYSPTSRAAAPGSGSAARRVVT